MPWWCWGASWRHCLLTWWRNADKKWRSSSLLTGMWDFMGTLPADLPKIIVVEDLTKPVIYGSMWGEVGKSSKVVKYVNKNLNPCAKILRRWTPRTTSQLGRWAALLMGEFGIFRRWRMLAFTPWAGGSPSAMLLGWVWENGGSPTAFGFDFFCKYNILHALCPSFTSLGRPSWMGCSCISVWSDRTSWSTHPCGPTWLSGVQEHCNCCFF